MNPTFEVVSSPYGRKLSINFGGYPGKEVIKAIKALPWQNTHRAYNAKSQCWEIDLSEESIHMFEETTGIPIPSKFKKHTSKEAFLVIPENHTWFFAEGIDEAANSVLYTTFSYPVEGAEFSPRYKRGEWDGYDHLYSKKWKGGPIGLVKKAENTLTNLGYKVEIINKNHPLGPKIHYKWNFPFRLREYQEDAILAAMNKGSGIIALPTGSGKTLIGLKLIYLLDSKALVVVHTKELLEQWKERIRSVLGVEPGQIGDGKWIEKDITVAMLQTLSKNGRNLGHYNLLIVDETHRIPADTWYRVALNINAYWRFGLTATPWRNDGKDLKIEASVGGFISDIKLEPLIEAGFLAEPEFQVITHSTTAGGYDFNQVINNYIVNNDPRNKAIVDKAVELVSQGHKVLVDVKRVKHGEILTSMIRERGIYAEFLCGEDKSSHRQEVLASFRNGLNCLVSTLVKEGVDIPSMSAIILAGGGKSSVMLIQTIGRALRPLDGRKAVIVDIEDRGKFVWEHFYSRQETLKEYYGKFYEENKHYKVGPLSVQMEVIK